MLAVQLLQHLLDVGILPLRLQHRFTTSCAASMVKGALVVHSSMLAPASANACMRANCVR